MTKDTRSKSKSWFKSVVATQRELDPSVEEEQVSTELWEDQTSTDGDPSPSDFPSKKQLFSKNNQDKLSLDLIISLENMLDDRQLLIYNNKDREDQLDIANETMNRLKHDLKKKEQLLEDKSKEIGVLENNLTNKQMSYDQLLEDYKDYQYHAKNDYEKVSTQLEKEINKYNKLNEEAKKNQYESMAIIKDLEEKVRNLEVENQKYMEQCEKILAEKNDLMKTINDFTERMSMSFLPKASNPTQKE